MQDREERPDLPEVALGHVLGGGGREPGPRFVDLVGRHLQPQTLLKTVSKRLWLRV